MDLHFAGQLGIDWDHFIHNLAFAFRLVLSGRVLRQSQGWGERDRSQEFPRGLVQFFFGAGSSARAGLEGDGSAVPASWA
jgi:hypothetical protein